MQYRLGHADAARRQDYAASRWAAPPAELIERALARPVASTGNCRLSVALDEFIQVFDSPQSSRMVLEARVSLLAGQQAIAQRAFAVAPAAPSADARGGVAAAAMAVPALATEMAQWLGRVVADGQPGAKACLGK
jgi:cholesterol transport system auxiliary component